MKLRRLLVASILALASFPATPAQRAGALATGAEGEFHPLDPSRIYDSRGTTPIGHRAVRNVRVAGLGGVPSSGVLAVALNVTVDRPSATTYLSVFPRDDATTDPQTSNLNFRAGQSTPNMVITRLGLGGDISIFNGSGTTHVLVDVMGWFTTAGGPPGTLYHTLAPTRVVDTRGPGRFDGTIRPVGPDDRLTVSLTAGQPTAVAKRSAAMLNVTATDQTGASYLQVYPFDGTAALPATSNLNFRLGQGAVPNAVITKLNPSDGQIGFYNFTGTVNVLADMFGYFDDGTSVPSGQLLRVLPQPVRVVDTRSGVAPAGSAGPGRFTLVAGETRSVKIAGNAGVPTGATAGVLNITVDRPAASGFISVYPADQAATEGQKTSTLNFVPGVTVPNLSIAPLALAGVSIGQIAIFNGSLSSVDILVDVFGYFVLAP